MAKNKPDILFDPPIEMDLGNNPKKVRFTKLSTFHDWLANDIQFWADIDAKLPRNQLPQALRRPVQSAINQRNTLKLSENRDVGSLNDRGEIEKILEAYAEGNLLHSETEIAAHMSDLADRSSLTELSYLYIATGPGPEGFEIQNTARNGVIDLVALLRASAHIEAYRGPHGKQYAAKINDLVEQAQSKYKELIVSAMDTIEIHNKAQEIANNASSMLTDTNGIQTQINSLSKDLERRISEALAPHQARIETVLEDAKSEVTKAQKTFDAANEAYKEIFNRHLDNLETSSNKRFDGFVQSIEDRSNFKITEEFWEKKRKQHLYACKLFGGIFIAGIVTAVILLAMFGPYYLTLIGIFNEKHELIITDFNIPLAVFATLPVIGAFWILRQFLKLFLTNLAQHSDADERIAMTETFLVLEGAGKLSDEDRVLIIRALFRPGPGSDDSDGGMPANWFDILAKRLEPKS